MPVRAKLIGRASDDMLSQFLGKLQRFNGTAFFQEALAEAVPTVRVLLSHASTTSPVAPKGNAYAARPYNVDPETQERMDKMTKLIASAKLTSTATVTIPVTETTTATSTTTKTKTTPAAVPAKRGDGPPFPWLPVGAGLFLFATAVLTRRRSA